MDAVKELIDAIKNRLNSSITGSYILSWLVVNWKFIFILIVSPLPVMERISLAEQNLNYWIGFGVPLVFMVFYVLGLPFLDSKTKKLLKSTVIANERLANDIVSEVTGSRDALLIKNKEHEKTIADLNKKIGALENSLQNIEIENSKIENRNKDLSEALDRLKTIQAPNIFATAMKDFKKK